MIHGDTQSLAVCRPATLPITVIPGESETDREAGADIKNKKKKILSVRISVILGRGGGG